MGKYKIKYNYEDGDSVETYNREEILELEWDKLDIAKQNLKRIQEHYEWYYKIEGHSFGNIKGRENAMNNPPAWWDVGAEKRTPVKNYDHYRVNLITDDGKSWIMSCPWCGYFERLNSAEIIEDDSDMRFTINY